MRINHLDLPVADVVATAKFLVEHFDLKPVTRVDSPAIVVLTDDGGFSFVLQRRSDPAATLPEGMHLGFIVDEPAKVHAHRARLAEAGLHVSEVQRNARGVQCYCRGPGELLVEVSCPRAE